MGMYTELYLSLSIRGDIPADAREALYFLFGDGDQPTTWPDHEAFTKERVTCGLLGRGNSFYFVPRSVKLFDHETINDTYVLISRSDIKNYEEEIEAFLDWLGQYVHTPCDEHVGHIRYEEDHRPTLLFATEKGIRYEAFVAS